MKNKVKITGKDVKYILGDHAPKRLPLKTFILEEKNEDEMWWTEDIKIIIKILAFIPIVILCLFQCFKELIPRIKSNFDTKRQHKLYLWGTEEGRRTREVYDNKTRP